MSGPLKVILTGATGMVGEGVLFECLANPAVAEVLLVGRKPYPLEHPRLKQAIAPDFMQLSVIEPQLAGYDACFFCAGISSVGLSEAEYTHITYDLTLHFAETLVRLNPQMTFVYVSGAQTDSSENGRSMWARVKGRTENALARLPFRAEYNFRPGFMKSTPGQRNVKKWYPLFAWLYFPLRLVAPNLVSTLKDVALAMIHVARSGYEKNVLEVRDINAAAKN
jgi:uncharacterized protein YbjT (DUF2867 family)